MNEFLMCHHKYLLAILEPFSEMCRVGSDGVLGRARKHRFKLSAVRSVSGLENSLF